MESRSKKPRFKELTVKLSKDELVRRLKSIALELANVDQEEHTDDLDALAASLVTPFILEHKDKDAKAIAAGCLADILRIYAPDPPYNEDQLKDIFNLIVKQLKYLENPDNQMYKRAFYLLESLALVKSFNICFDLDAQDIVTSLFQLFFSIVNAKHNVKVRNFMIDVMAPVIQESETLPQEVLEIILTHCLPSEKKANEVAYQMASNLIEKTSSALEPYVQLFFNNALVLEKGNESKLVNHLYDLIYELYNVNRSVLLSVLPQLEFKLKRNEESDRLEVVKLLGRMFADETFELAQQNRPLWLCFLGRYHDISADVRVEFIERAKTILIRNPALIADIVDHLLERYLDPDERVRQKVVVSVCEAASEKIDIMPKKLFDPLQDRMRDKKWGVRKEALTCVAKLYKRLISREKVKAATLKKISWAPNRLVHAYYQNTIEDKLCVERIVHGCLIPVTLPDDERMKRLFNLYARFDEHAHCAFEGMIKYRGAINLQFQSLLEAWNHESDEEKEKLLSSRVIMLAMSLPEPFKAQVHLKKFVTLFSDKQLYTALETCSNIDNGCGKVMKAMGEVVKKLTVKNPIIDTVKALLDRGCNMLVDAGSLVKLLKHVKLCIDGYQDDDDEDEGEEEELLPKIGKQEHALTRKAKRGLLLIKCLASAMPTVFRSKECFQQMLLLIKSKEDLVVESSLKVVSCVADALQNLDKSVSSCFQPVLRKIALEGSPKKAKYAIRSIFKMLNDPANLMDRICNSIIDNFSHDSPNILSNLASLGEIAKAAPEIFEKRHKYIIREMIVKEIMVKDREPTSDSQESDDEWCDIKYVTNETRIKIQCIQAMVKWLEGIQSGFQNAATPVCRLLHTLLKNDGDLNANGLVSAQNRAHLRLAAATAFIKLAQIPNCWDVITLEQYRQVALTIQDSCYDVRHKFSLKLHKALDILKLPLDYLAIFALSAVDPAKDRKQQVKQMIAKNAQTRREYIKQHSLAQAKPFAILPEYVLPFLIHLLAHHPDFDNTKLDCLKETKEYLWFFLETIMGPKGENQAFLKKLAENIKQTKDAEDPDNETLNEKIYAVCDLTVWLIMNKPHSVVLKDFPGNPVLPKKLFAVNSDKKQLNTKIYLPKEFGGLTAPKKKVAPLDIHVQPPLKFQTSTPAVHNQNAPLSTEEETEEAPITPMRDKTTGNHHEIKSTSPSELFNLPRQAMEDDITFSPTLKKAVHYPNVETQPQESHDISSKGLSTSTESEQEEKKEVSQTEERGKKNRKRHLETSDQKSDNLTLPAKIPKDDEKPTKQTKRTGRNKDKEEIQAHEEVSAPLKVSRAPKQPGRQTKLTAFSKNVRGTNKPKASPAKPTQKQSQDRKSTDSGSGSGSGRSTPTRTTPTKKGTPQGKGQSKSPVSSSDSSTPTGTTPTKSRRAPAKRSTRTTPSKKGNPVVKSASKSPDTSSDRSTPVKSPPKRKSDNTEKNTAKLSKERSTTVSSKTSAKQNAKRKLSDTTSSPSKSTKTSKTQAAGLKNKKSPQKASSKKSSSPVKRNQKGQPSKTVPVEEDKSFDFEDDELEGSPLKQGNKTPSPSAQSTLQVKRSRSKRR